MALSSVRHASSNGEDHFSTAMMGIHAHDRRQHDSHLLHSPDGSMSYSSYPSSSSDSSFSSMASSSSSTASSSLSHTGSDIHPHSTRLERKQRRYLNRLAVYLPKPLRPIASSPARFIATLALTAISILFLSSSLSSHPHTLPAFASNAASSFLPLARRSFRSPTTDSHGLPRILDDTVGDKADVKADTVGNTRPDTHQAVKRDEQLVLNNDSPHDFDDRKAPLQPKSSKEKAESKESCKPDGYIRGVDAFKENAPTALLRDNLRKDLKYLTFGMTNGFTSQFTALANGIYLAKLSDRVPVLPPFASSAHSDRKEAGYLTFSKVYDVTYLETMLRHPVQEWSNLKKSAEQTAGLGEEKDEQFKDDKIRAKALSKIKREKISCWSLWAAQMPTPGKPAGSAVQHHLGLDIDYWQIPQEFSHPPQDRHVRYWDLVMLDKDINAVKSDHLANVAQSKRSDKTAKLPAPPDDQLMCFDTLYYTAATGPQEWWQPHAPVWKAVGRYVRFNQDVSNLADDYLRSILDVDKNAKVPEFISVHIRQGTAKRICKDNEDCLPQLDGYKRAVNRVREAILEARGIYVRWVVVTTDDMDPAFLGSIESLGWSVVDHTEMRTRELHGLWWEVVLDSAIQSKGSGFVGTDRSSM